MFLSHDIICFALNDVRFTVVLLKHSNYAFLTKCLPSGIQLGHYNRNFSVETKQMHHPPLLTDFKASLDFLFYVWTCFFTKTTCQTIWCLITNNHYTNTLYGRAVWVIVYITKSV